MAELAERLLIRPQSAVGLANRLAGRGLVRHVAGERDKRQVHVQLTEPRVAALARLTWLRREALQYFGPQLLQGLHEAFGRRDLALPLWSDRCTIGERA